MSEHFAIIVVLLALFAYSSLSKSIGRSYLTMPMIATGFGWIMGSGALNLLSWDINNEVVHLLAEVTLVLVLFSDASRINLKSLVKDHNIPVRMLVIGMPLTIIVGALVAKAVSPEAPWALAFLVAAILTPTDAALGQAVVTSPDVPDRIRRSINVESGLNDGIALPFVMIFGILASAAFGGLGEDAPENLYLFTFLQITLGPLVGIAVGWAAAWVLNKSKAHSTISTSFQGIAFLATAACCYLLAEEVGGNGFIAAFLGGLLFGNKLNFEHEFLFEFMESEGQMFTMATFFIFGAIMVPLGLAHASFASVTAAICFLTFVRMIPIAISVAGMKLSWYDKFFLGWFGPRGLASVLFALMILERFPIPGGDEVYACVVLTVIMSIVAHGLSAKPLIKKYV